MTHTTEQERAEFEAWFMEKAIAEDRDRYGRTDSELRLYLQGSLLRWQRHQKLYSRKETQHRWEAWQAARRAPAVPADALEKAKKYDHLFPYLCKTCGGFGLVDRRCHDDPLGSEPCPDCNSPAVPVPQGLREAAQAVVERWDTPLWKDVPATAVYIADLRAALAAAPQPPEVDMGIPISAAAPVQLPEPPFWYCESKTPDAIWPIGRTTKKRESAFKDGYFNQQALYTEQQVRQLLAQHARAPLTENQWQKLWEEWFDGPGDAEDLIRSIERAHGITGDAA